MGGKGSGGHRVGAGRRRQSAVAGELTGSRRARARDKKAAAAPDLPNQTTNQTAASPADVPLVVEVQIPQPPGNLTLDELAEWNDLAPRAAKVGTLNDDTQWALVDLCQARVLKGKLLRDIDRIGNVVPAGGGKVGANPLLARYTTLLQRVDAGMMRFKIAPMGKEIEGPAEKPGDSFAEFDGPSTTASGETVN